MKDNSEKVYLEYSFFIPTSVWNSLYDFENDFAKFLEAKNLEGIVFNNFKGSVGFKRIVDISIKPEPALPQPPQVKNTTTPSDRLKQMAGESPNKKPEGKMRTGPLNAFPKRVISRTQFNVGKRFQTKYK